MIQPPKNPYLDNNELFKRLRYALQIDDPTARRILKQGSFEATTEQVVAWRLSDSEAEFDACPNEAIAAFLAGYIIERRGARDDKPVPPPSKARIQNNTVLKLLKIALEMRSEDVLSILTTDGASFSISEVSALLRKPGSRNYRQCGDQVLRRFIDGVGRSQRNDVTPSVWADALKKIQ